MQRLVLLLVGIAVGYGLYVTGSLPTPPGQGEPTDFCATYAVVTDRPVEQHGELRVLMGEPVENRQPCGDDGTVHHYLPPGTDGIVWDDCVVSWVGGGESRAAAEGIPCFPAAG